MKKYNMKDTPNVMGGYLSKSKPAMPMAKPAMPMAKTPSDKPTALARAKAKKKASHG